MHRGLDLGGPGFAPVEDRVKGFRVASEASTAQHLAVTAMQIVVFWSFFLFVLPEGVVAIEASLELPPMGLANHQWIGGVLFGLASCLGLASATVMAVRGRGTPLPLQSAREFVVTGPYKVVRNPMALAGITQGVAVGIWRDSGLVVIYALCGAFLWHFVARPPEERNLLERFDEPFADYRDRVALWVPRLGNKSTERAIGGGLMLAVCIGAAWLPTTVAWPTLTVSMVLFGYVLARPAAKATSSGHSSSKSASKGS